MIEIRLLGELDVERDGRSVPLPASRKSRALLGYLAATGKPHRRERLCELLWEGPDDPRASLRWSLARLRPVVAPHLVAKRDAVELSRDGVSIDIENLRAPAAATTAALEEAVALFRGEFLEGLDLPSCYRWQQWCAGERERWRRKNLEILAELTRRLGATDAALGHARRRVALDPFGDDAHGALIRLLAALGRTADAMRQYDACRDLFERELDSKPGDVVENARRAIASIRAKSHHPAETSPETSDQRRATAFIGRAAELRAIDEADGVVLLTGEPGIGKSRLLAEARARRDGTTLYGRAFAAEMIRPYGVWIDAVDDFPAAEDRAELFDAVVERLADVALVAIDDLQWIDEASTALLHYVARKGRARIVCSARSGEIEDNPHARRLVRELAREGRLLEIAVGPLSPEETRALVRDERAARLSGGNPLFALELARSEAADALSKLIAARLDALEGGARELVGWAAAVGREFDAEIVGRATGMPAGAMLGALEKLERSAIIRASGARTYDFTHDLLREAAYQRIAGPRRALVHRHIARAIRETHDPDASLAGDLLHHATLGGEPAVAAAAAIDAGKRCLRMFAYAEATSVARRGLQLAESLAGAERVTTDVELMHILVMARTPIAERLPLAGRIADLVEAAHRLGLTASAAKGAHLLACLHEESNDYSGAAVASIRSEELGRAGDPATLANTIANTARCLLVLQREIPRAEALVREAAALGIPNTELSLALGYLHAHRGEAEEAARHLDEAAATAEAAGDHWRESVALFRLVTLALEESDARLALARCARMREVASKMRGGSEAVRSDVLETIARHANGEAADVDGAIARLRAIDSKSDLAWVLAYLAARESDAPRARAWAREALETAEAVGRQSEAVIAKRILRLPVKASPDLSASARSFLKRKEAAHAQTRARADV
ncbi:MAG: ATP-binding protein [Thermoanaerobaculia bacterium]